MPTDPDQDGGQPGGRRPPAPDAHRQGEPHRHPWSLRIGSVAGIPIRLHATFGLLLLWVAWMANRAGEPVGAQVGLVLGLFFCVVLHELGHALTAKLFGIRTRDITLYPIGGVSNLQSMGSAHQELLISLAGPAINIVIAIAIGALLISRGEPLVPADLENGRLSFLQWLLAGNIILALFNIVPAFPMDGGRILRAALALFMDRTRATQIAARVGQLMAVMMGLWGLLEGNFVLMIIAVFVFLGAGAEAEAQRTVATTGGYHMRDAMVTRFETVSHGDTLGDVVERLLRTSQEDFPVVHGERVLGLLTRRQLLSSLATEGRDALVAGAMTREFPAVAPGDDLTQALELLKAAGSAPILVFEQERLVGMVTLDNLVEFLSVARAGAVPPPSST
jgi:Zn-dependent protease/CBS domain-containing protein